MYAVCVNNSVHEKRSLYELCSEIPVLNIPCEELRHCVVFNLDLIIYLQYFHQTTVPCKQDVGALMYWHMIGLTPNSRMFVKRNSETRKHRHTKSRRRVAHYRTGTNNGCRLLEPDTPSVISEFLIEGNCRTSMCMDILNDDIGRYTYVGDVMSSNYCV